LAGQALFQICFHKGIIIKKALRWEIFFSISITQENKSTSFSGFPISLKILKQKRWRNNIIDKDHGNCNSCVGICTGLQYAGAYSVYFFIVVIILVIFDTPADTVILLFHSILSYLISNLILVMKMKST